MELSLLLLLPLQAAEPVVHGTLQQDAEGKFSINRNTMKKKKKQLCVCVCVGVSVPPPVLGPAP